MERVLKALAAAATVVGLEWADVVATAGDEELLVSALVAGVITYLVPNYNTSTGPAPWQRRR
jgi:uncharacterized membrane protein